MMSQGRQTTRMHAEQIIELVETLRVKDAQDSLSLDDANVDDRGVNLIAEALRNNTTWASLNLINNEFESSGCASLFQALEINGTLGSLWLSRNKRLTYEGCNALREALERNTSLHTLCLNWTELGEGAQGTTALAEGLRVNTSLRHLHLIGSLRGSDGCAALGHALRKNNTLQSLYLSSNDDIQAEARETWTSLANALDNNTGLKILHLQDSSITTEGCELFADALECNKTLEVLDLRRNYLQRDGKASFERMIRKFQTALHANGLLRNLDIKFNFGSLPTPAIALSFAMGQHARLGEKSPVMSLDTFVISMILDMYLKLRIRYNGFTIRL